MLHLTVFQLISMWEGILETHVHNISMDTDADKPSIMIKNNLSNFTS